MARITVDDSLQYVDNRFDLVLLASKRARQLMGGVQPLIPLDNDKPTVIALREIAEGLITKDTIDTQELTTEEDALSDDDLVIALGEELSLLSS